MIRVLHTIDTTGPGGAETVFINLVKGLDSKIFESVVVIHGPGWVCDALRSNRIEPIFVQSRGGFNIAYLRGLISIIKQHKIDVIQAHLFGSALYSSMAGLICRIPVISTIHGFVDTNDKERLRWLKTKLINIGSKRTVFVSERLREHFVKNMGFAVEKAITIYNGVDTSVFYPNKDVSIRNEYGICSDEIVIGAVGNIRPAKGYDIFLEAAKLLYDKNQKFRFIVAGQGSGVLYDQLIKLRKRLELEDVFHFIGFQGNAATVYNNMDIFLLPSTSEGFSISTLEAMACGLPVVVTKSGGPEEILEITQNGVLAENASPRDISNKIILLADTCQLNNNKNMNEFHRSSFPIEKMIDRYCMLYKQETSLTK